MTGAVLNFPTSDSPSGGRAAEPEGWRAGLAWVLQLAGAVVAAFSGAAKLTGMGATVAMFDAIGVGQWFRYATGAVEMVGAVLLFAPAAAGIGAALLIAVAAGGVVVHQAVMHHAPARHLPMLAAMLVVAWLRRAPLVRLAAFYGFGRTD